LNLLEYKNSSQKSVLILFCIFYLKEFVLLKINLSLQSEFLRKKAKEYKS